MAPIRILLTNDDGPPSRDSPFILGFDVKVVIPSSQKSWIGKAFHIKEKITGRYYYPRQHPNLKPETSHVSRPLKEGELGEWILLDGTPATCANIGLHNLYPREIDLVVSGPNFGRNTSSAFVLSSGTVGAALSSSLCLVRSIALSYGGFLHPSPPEYVQPAHELSVRVLNELWTNWGTDPQGIRNGEVDLYNVNIPLTKEILNEKGMDVVWTTIWRNHYGSLFQRMSANPRLEASPAGPNALSTTSNRTTNTDATSSPTTSSNPADAHISGPSAPSLAFRFAPEMGSLVNPPLDSLPFGSDAWAVHHGKASVTPLRTSFLRARRAESHVSIREGRRIGPGRESGQARSRLEVAAVILILQYCTCTVMPSAFVPPLMNRLRPTVYICVRPLESMCVCVHLIHRAGVDHVAMNIEFISAVGPTNLCVPRHFF
ncbi:hypothetical protein BS47DRAFT_1437345 [Hydnum rufescens UP504]|uniref:Survival protein SurE-like phosphatase/nucleotidase domain-containing protein n=1 Tax=Hydnum rufescens UP504 TaxID=1448309 RepID=A0A9P6AHH3_9AGAM|nr:hypothetical protein BS47DRAFT_1437345 [Hydnum rufescens UP504]